MKTALLSLILLTQCSPVPAIEMSPDGKAVLLPIEQQRLANCASMGGCFVVTAAEIVAIIKSEAEKLADGKTCKRDSI